MRFSIPTTAFALLGRALAGPGVSPASVNQTSDPGLSFLIKKAVSTPEIPPKPDVVLLVDVTASMSSTLANIKTNLATVISTVKGTQPGAEFAVVSFGDLADPNGFKVNQGLTADSTLLQKAVDSLKADLGRDDPEDWINALWQVSNGAISFREGSSRMVVLVGDETSHDPSGGHTLAQAIASLVGKKIRVIAVNVKNLDGKGQATAVTRATGGLIIGSAANEVSKAIVSGLRNLDVTIKPEVVSCDKGLSVAFSPAVITVISGATVSFDEKVVVAEDAAQAKSLSCSVRFLLNGAAGGAAFLQNVTVPVNQMGCFTCNPQVGKNLCHPTTSCVPTPFGTQCLTRPGFKADKTPDDDVKVQWRMKWPSPGHEHRVAVKPGTSADTPCKKGNDGPDVCKEVVLAKCVVVKSEVEEGQKVLGDEEL